MHSTKAATRKSSVVVNGRSQRPLQGKVALVAGATRGAGRGIARALGEAGATVYCSGRSSRDTRATTVRARKRDPFDLGSRPETIEESAELVSAAGGLGIAVRTDHLDEEQVKSLFGRIRKEHGTLDILVNDIWGGDALTEWDKSFWEQSLEKGFRLLEQAVHSHIITSRHGIPLLLESKKGLLVEVTDGELLNYRGSFFYDLAKVSVIRMAFALSEELRDKKITVVAVTPGFLRSEAM